MDIDICRLWEYCPRNTDMSKKSKDRLCDHWSSVVSYDVGGIMQPILRLFWHVSYVYVILFDLWLLFPSLWLIDVISVIFSPCKTWKAPPSSWVPYLSKAAGWVNSVRHSGRGLVLSIIWNSLFAPPEGVVSKNIPALISNCTIRISPVEWWQQTSLI